MNGNRPADIRNFAIVGHATSGKTMLSEAMLQCGGAVHRMGAIAQGSTVSDYHVGEQQRHISIHGTPLNCEWQGRRFNFIDTPGYLDFSSEAIHALRVADFALIVVHAGHGIGVGTELMWDYAGEFGIPRMIVVNCLDKEKYDFDHLVEEIRERFGTAIFPMQVPIDPGPGFHQVLDVLRSEVVSYATDRSGKFTEEPAAGKWKERVDAMHKELIEHIAESDDTLLQKFFDEGGLSEQVMRTGIHPAVQNQVFVPLFCASGETNVGVARLMDFIAQFGSSPDDRKTVGAVATATGSPVLVRLDGAEPVAYVFKTLTDPQSGDLSIFRVYSGTIKPGMDLHNSDRRVGERMGQLYRLNGKIRTAVDALTAGDIGAAVKLRDTHTGNTLCDVRHAVALPKVQYPTPYTQAALKLNAPGDEEKLAAGLAALHEEDPAFTYHTDPELHQFIIAAQGELHLEVLFERLKRRYKVDVSLEPPKIRYRETIRGKAEARYRHKKQTGGAGQFAEVWVRIEPGTRDSGVNFEQSLVGQDVDRVFVPSVEKGVKTAGGEGIHAGYRVTDVKIDFFGGKMHPVDSKDIAFQIAGYFAFREAFQNARPVLLEPIHELEIKVPEEFVGRVVGDLSGRRGRILGMDVAGRLQIIKAQVPAAQLYHYGTVLRSLTGGRGLHAERFSHYEEMPPEQEKKHVEEYQKARAAGTAGHVHTH
ncbi:MAG TPA: elongation factor G [Candidatus Didemnitutus sp.]|nr:elongation factor G [Candidatus Didemnitutus sp.]